MSAEAIPRCSQNDGERYKHTAKKFLLFLGERSKLPLHLLAREMLERFRDTEAKTTTSSTACLKIKTLGYLQACDDPSLAGSMQ